MVWPVFVASLSATIRSVDVSSSSAIRAARRSRSWSMTARDSGCVRSGSRREDFPGGQGVRQSPSDLRPTSSLFCSQAVIRRPPEGFLPGAGWIRVSKNPSGQSGTSGVDARSCPIIVISTIATVPGKDRAERWAIFERSKEPAGVLIYRWPGRSRMAGPNGSSWTAANWRRSSVGQRPNL